MQDIINKTKLSKGAIYHHFASKEEIFVAMVKRIGEDNAEILAKVRDDKSLNGYEKLKAIFFGAKLFITLIGDPEKRLNAAKSCNPRFESLLPKDVRTSIRNFVLTLEN